VPSILLIILIASVGAMLFARFLARTRVSRPSAEAARIPPATSPALAAGPPKPPEVAIAQSPMPIAIAPTPLAVVRERPMRRLNPAAARTGIVLAAILEPCRSHLLSVSPRLPPSSD
jgi:hypothetical protein